MPATASTATAVDRRMARSMPLVSSAGGQSPASEWAVGAEPAHLCEHEFAAGQACVLPENYRIGCDEIYVLISSDSVFRLAVALAGCRPSGGRW
jgi:hypothetical protein